MHFCIFSLKVKYSNTDKEFVIYDALAKLSNNIHKMRQRQSRADISVYSFYDLENLSITSSDESVVTAGCSWMNIIFEDNKIETATITIYADNANDVVLEVQ